MTYVYIYLYTVVVKFFFQWSLGGGFRIGISYLYINNIITYCIDFYLLVTLENFKYYTKKYGFHDICI